MNAVSCGAGSDADKGSGGDGTGLASALSGVPASVGEQTLPYRDVKAARRLLAADKALYAGLGGFGVWELSGGHTTATSTKESYGFGAGDVGTQERTSDLLKTVLWG